MEFKIDIVTFSAILIAVICLSIYATEVVYARRIEKLKEICDELKRAIKREKKCVARLKQQCDIVKNAKNDGEVTLYADNVPYLTIKEGDLKKWIKYY